MYVLPVFSHSCADRPYHHLAKEFKGWLVPEFKTQLFAYHLEFHLCLGNYAFCLGQDNLFIFLWVQLSTPMIEMHLTHISQCPINKIINTRLHMVNNFTWLQNLSNSYVYSITVEYFLSRHAFHNPSLTKTLLYHDYSYILGPLKMANI